MRVPVQPLAQRAQKLCESSRGAALLAILRGDRLSALRKSLSDFSEPVQQTLLNQARCTQLGRALVSLGLFGSLLEYSRYLDEEVGAEGPPQSPLVLSWVDGHVLMDASVGIGHESPLTVVAYLAKTLLSDEDMTTSAESLAQSFPRVFMIEEVTDSSEEKHQLVSLRCIFSEEVFSAITFDAQLPQGRLALIRLVGMSGGGLMIFGAPYLLLNDESTWRQHLKEVTHKADLPSKKPSRRQKKSRKGRTPPAPSPLDRLRSYMRRGPREDYWCQYLLDGCVGVHADCVQLAGLPSLPQSLPHHPDYAGLLADEWADTLEADPVHCDERSDQDGFEKEAQEEADHYFWDMLRQADAPLKSIWELGSPEPLIILRGILGEICEAEGYLETARKDLHEALGWFQTDLPDAELHGFVPVFHTYAALARVGARRTTAIEMAEASLAALPNQGPITKLARAFQNTYFSLFQILRVDQEEGFETLDLLRNRRVYVHEKSTTLSLTTQYILAAWVVDLPNGRSELEGSLLALPQVLGEHVLDLVREHRAEWRASSSLGWRVRAARVTPLVLAALAQAVNRPRLTLVTTDDENICFSTARYNHQDQAAINQILGEQLGPSEDGRFLLVSNEEVLLATIRVTDSILRVECHSRERLASTKTLLEAWLHDLISAGLDSFEDGQAALEDALRGGATPSLPPASSPEISEFLEDFLLRQVRKTLDEPIPMFSGRTIRQLAHSSKAEDREKARAWLRSQEDLFSRSTETTQTVELTSVWEELALER